MAEVDATLLEEEMDNDPIARREIQNLNMSLASTAVFVIIFIIFSAIWGGHTSNSLLQDEVDLDDWRSVPLKERHQLDLNLTSWRSQLPEKGSYNVLPMTEHFVEVDLPVSEQDAGYPEDALMHVALWLPSNTEMGEKVPVIATVHPYYDFGTEIDDSNPNTIPDLGVGQWIFEEFISHGYAMAQVSTFGSGQSTHCQDVKGLGEQIGIQAAVEWLGTQNWSNGNVGLMGKSYAGTTNWEAAQNPSEHLKTIVPISGSIGVQQMFYRNGSAEARSMGYDLAYELATADPTTDDLRICQDDIWGPAAPVSTYVAAEWGGDEGSYWEERYHLGDVIDNYDGSVYIVWGMQDWNVDPYHAFPTYQMLRDKGLTVRGIMGQWGHNYPDQGEVHSGLSSGYGKEAYENMSRMDWAIELFNWFEYWLKGIGDETESYVQMQTHDGRWHLEETWPPEDMIWEFHDLSEWSGSTGVVSANSAISIVSPVFEEEIHLSGLPTLHLDVQTVGCNGGQIFATLWDETLGLRLGHAVMDLRYRDGGYDAKPVSPILGSYTMLMEFNPLDVVLPAGHMLSIELTDTGEDYLPSTCAVTGLTVQGGTFGMPVIERSVTHESWFEVAHYDVGVET